MHGDAIGILFGVGSALLLTNMLAWQVSISPAAIVTAVVFSVAIGIFFGFYPARKAARLDPIKALRYQ